MRAKGLNHKEHKEHQGNLDKGDKFPQEKQLDQYSLCALCGSSDCALRGSVESHVPARDYRVAYRPPEAERRIVPDQRELRRAFVVGRLFVMEDGELAHDDVAVAESWRDQHLEPVVFREREPLPAPILRMAWIVVDDQQVKAPDEARHQFPGSAVAVHAAEHVARRGRNIVLDEVDVDAVLAIEIPVVELDVRAAEV